MEKHKNFLEELKDGATFGKKKKLKDNNWYKKTKGVE